MLDHARLAISITDGRGFTARLSYDELDAGNLPTDISYSSNAPGGHKDLSFGLLRDLFPRLDEAPFNRVKVYGRGGRVVWSGRYATLGRQTGTNFSLSPTAVGMQAHLTDDTSFMEVYVDRETGAWGEPPLARRSVLVGAGFNTTSSNGLQASVEGGLVWDVADSVPPEAVSELWYTAPGSIRIKSVEFNGTRSGTWTGFESPTLWGYTSPTTGQISTTDSSFGLSMHEVILSNARRHVALRVYNASGTTLTPPAGTRQVVADIATYGNHGLSRYFYDNTQPSGVKGADVLADAISRAAPMLRYTTGTNGTIQPTGSLIIPHLVFREPTTVAAVIAEVNKFYGWDWLVWDDTFHYQPAGSGVVWRATRADGASLSNEGPSADELYNGALVIFTDVDGQPKIVGPAVLNLYEYTAPGPGGSGYDTITLLDTDEGNPVNNAGIPRRWLQVNLTGIGMTTPAIAANIGQIQLTEANANRRRGQVTVQGTVTHPSGTQVPVGEIRAGDAITFGDLFGYQPQRIDECSYNHQSRTATLGINGPLARSEAILERLSLFTSLVN